MIVVSDSSAIISLSAVGQLDLLPSLYGNVIIPTAVANELRDARPNSPGRSAVDADWLQIAEVQDRAAVRRFESNLDPGEAEALELALELKADLLLIDERHGREVALRHGLPIIGVLGVLSRKAARPPATNRTDSRRTAAESWLLDIAGIGSADSGRCWRTPRSQINH